MELARQEKIWLSVDVCLHTIGSLRFLFFFLSTLVAADAGT